MLGWDEEAQAEAEQQAAAIQRRDPDAARLLLHQRKVEQRQAHRRRVAQADDPLLDQSSFTPAKVYDPLDLYCRLAREFHWRDGDMDEMDYVRFFGYVDRLGQQQRQEARARPGGQGGYDPIIVEAEQQAWVNRLVPTPQEYKGTTVRYGG